MLLLTNGITLTFTLSDLLILTGIACLIVLTVYFVLTLKSLIRLLNESTNLVNESSKIVEDVQVKTKAVEALRLQPLFSLTFAQRANISHFAKRNISRAAGVFHPTESDFTVKTLRVFTTCSTASLPSQRRRRRRGAFLRRVP